MFKVSVINDYTQWRKKEMHRNKIRHFSIHIKIKEKY